MEQQRISIRRGSRRHLNGQGSGAIVDDKLLRKAGAHALSKKSGKNVTPTARFSSQYAHRLVGIVLTLNRAARQHETRE